MKKHEHLENFVEESARNCTSEVLDIIMGFSAPMKFLKFLNQLENRSKLDHS